MARSFKKHKLKRTTKKTPEDRLLEVLKTLPKIDFERAWRETLKERRRSG